MVCLSNMPTPPIASRVLWTLAKAAFKRPSRSYTCGLLIGLVESDSAMFASSQVNFGQGRVAGDSVARPDSAYSLSLNRKQRKTSELSRYFPRNPATSRLSVNYIIAQSTIRPDGHRAVEALFLLCSALESRSFFLAVQLGNLPFS